MTIDASLVPLIAAAILAFGSFAGFAAGREAERRRPIRRRVGTPE